MKRTATLLLLLIFSTIVIAQETYVNRPSAEHPFGKPHPEAPKEIMDYAPLIGVSDCQSVSRVSQTEWADTVSMEWHWKYILNGWGIQDETLKADGTHSGSIRQFNADSAQWYVHYYTTSAATPTLNTWAGDGREGGDIVLYMPQKAPNGFDGFFKIRFSDISDEGFNWEGAWVDPAETINYSSWRIFCRKRVD
ncbi:MAG: hypothetical protein RIF33_11770 [Cyclobacteriaceae bacterium]